MVDEHSKVQVTLLMAKGRVAPTKLMTIPRLELQAAVEAAKLSATLKAELNMKINKEYFWSDSAVALGYIKNSEHRYHMFAANRVQTIRSNSKCEQWHHVPGKANPADLVSRGANLFSLQKSAWWDGPQFLHASDIRKNLNNEYSGETLPEDPEIKRPKQALYARKAQPEERKLHFERHGSWTKLIRAIATAKTMLKNRSWRKPNLDVFLLQEAEKIVIKLTQREYYRDELKALRSSQSVHKQSSLLCLTPFLDKQGMMRIGGRARRSLVLSFKEKHPLILPEKAHVSKLLIERAHQKVYHQGQAMTLGALRTQGYWITAANKLVKRHIHQCAPCRAMRAPPVQQQMGELPQSRIEPTPPFTHIGMDCFGPYTVKDRRIEVKRWGLLLTCMYSRAIHIELLNSMSTDALINALRSFICIRGPVKTICCDNGTNFIGAKNELLASFASLGSGIQDVLKDSMIEFKFNAPSASHAGGVWERQIRTVKSVLNAMLPTYTTRMDTMALKTAFYEVMAIVNSRPLSVDNLNKPDEIVLTPNHLITMKPSQPTVVPGEFDNQEVYGRKMWRKVQQFAEHFWTEWRNQYFVHINKRQKWTKMERSIAIGDIVLIMDENLPRGQWLTAVVQQVFKDNDALVRRVQLRVANRHLDRQGKKMMKPSVLERPVQKLILLVPAIDS
ncbi:uncharacterized protein [Watersipora subatra]|uniref:uncharacterized protein n=1 Tax=Watersipora subatra TaxID=2589382 RepID=UPI00355AF3C1